MPVNLFVNRYVEIQMLGDQPEACLQTAPIGVRDGEAFRGVLLDPNTYKGLLRLAMVYEQTLDSEKRSETRNDRLVSFTRLGKRLLDDATVGEDRSDSVQSTDNRGDSEPS